MTVWVPPPPPSTPARPSPGTRPAATSASLARREATPAFARTFWIRSVGTSAPERGAGLRVGGERLRSVRLAPFLGQARRDLDIERGQLVERREAEALEELEAGA